MTQTIGRWLAGLSDLDHSGKAALFVVLMVIAAAGWEGRWRRLNRIAMLMLLLGVCSPLLRWAGDALHRLAQLDDWLAAVGGVAIAVCFVADLKRPPPAAGPADPDGPPSRAGRIRERLESEAAQESADKYTRE